MPLYNLVVMVKGRAHKQEIVDILRSAAKRVYEGKGIVTNVTSYGRVPLAYEIKKKDGRHSEAQMLEMGVMAPSSLANDLLFLNRDERLLRWMLVGHRGHQWTQRSNSEE
eukprot:TRINITY_DN7511_c0_g1_i1.p1 TRINITY_DN7511_c0_g1~~TRINITY_DN7511_c0_g1_i1.p1  ORF type:complete len:110 (+),score=23.39 TRINITY_DN7511_c0_g1_i1:207-536(+)